MIVASALRRPRALLAALLASGALVVACVGGAPTDAARLGKRADAIQNGKTDTTSSFAVAIVDDADGMCSGTLIAPNLVLTARHCVADDNGGDFVNCKTNRFFAPRAASSFKIDTRPSADFSTATYEVSKVVVPSDDLFCGNDLALLVTKTSIPAAVATPATPAIDPPLTDRTTYGTSLTAIGYGTTSPGGADDGTRRRRDGVSIDCVPGDSTGCSASTYDMTIAELAAGNGLCEGDSGSGAYDTKSIAAGAPIVMGVLSRAADSGSSCVDAVYERTDSASAFLIATAKDAAAAGGYPAPAWTYPKGTAPDDGGTSGGPEAGDDASSSSGDPAGTPAASSGTTTTTSGCSVAAPGAGSSAGGDMSAAARSSWMVAAIVTFLLHRGRRRRSRSPR